MTTGSNESVPVMPDVRTVRREARRITAILRWPIYLIFAVLFTVWTGLWVGGLYADKGAGIILIVFGLCIIVMCLFRKKTLRAFLGAQTPMIFENGSSGPLAPGAKSKIAWIAGLIAGGVIGFASQKLLDRQGGDLVDLVFLSCFMGGGIVATFHAWIQTRLWEFIMGTVLEVLVLGALQGLRLDDSRVTPLALAFAMLCSYLFAISFFLRWRKWVKSLPETVKTEKA